MEYPQEITQTWKVLKTWSNQEFLTTSYGDDLPLLYQFVVLNIQDEGLTVCKPSLSQFKDKDDNENDDIGYVIRITNLISLYEEKLSSNEIFQLCQKLNPKLEVPEIVDLVDHLSQLLDCNSNIKYIVPDHYEISCDNHSSFSRSLCKLTLKGEIAGYEFTWEFTPKLVDPVTFYSRLTKSTMTVLTVLMESHSNLVKTIEAKDKEIQNYIENGAFLSRKTLRTNIFNREEDSFLLSNRFHDLSLSLAITTSKYAESLKAFYHKQVKGCNLSEQTQLPSENEDVGSIKSQFSSSQKQKSKLSSLKGALSIASIMKAPQPTQSSQSQKCKTSKSTKKVLRKI